MAIAKFLSETGYTPDSLTATPDESVIQHARKIIDSWDVGEVEPRLLDAATDGGVGFGAIAYGHASHEVQVYVGLFTFLVIVIDDHACSADALHAFADKMRAGTPQMHPILDRLVEILDDASTHFPSIAAREIVRGTMAFIDSCALECEAVERPLRPGSFAYVAAKRQANGIGRAYACFVWDKTNFPDFFAYVQATP